MARLLMDGLREYFLTQGRRAPQTVGLSEGDVSRRTRAPRASRDCERAGPGHRRGHPGVPTRCQRRADPRRFHRVCRRQKRIPAHARSARGRGFPRSAGARPRPSRRDGRIHGEPLSARIALSPPAGRRVSGHERRAVAAGLAAGAVVARGTGAGGRPAARAHRSSWSATASSRSTAFATPTSASFCAPPVMSPQLRPGQDGVRHAIRRSFRAVPALLAFTNSLFDAVDKLPDRP